MKSILSLCSYITKRAIAYFIFGVVLLLAVVAGSSSAMADSSISDEIVYKQTLESCLAARDHYFGTLVNDDTKNAIMVGFGQFANTIVDQSDTANLQRSLDNNGLGVYAIDRLSSSGFIQAMQECFPDSRAKQAEYELSIIIADTVAKVPLIIGVAESASMIQRAIASIIGSAISHTYAFALSKSLSLLRADFILRVIYARYTTTINRILAASLIVYFLKSFISAKEESRVKAAADIKFENSPLFAQKSLFDRDKLLIAEVDSRLDLLNAKLETTLDPDNKIKIQRLIRVLESEIQKLNNIELQQEASKDDLQLRTQLNAAMPMMMIW